MHREVAGVGLSVADAAEAYLLSNTAIATTFTAFGALVCAHRPRHRIGVSSSSVGATRPVRRPWALLSGALVWSPAVERTIDLVRITAWVPAFVVCLPLIMQLYPDGRPLSPRWRWPAGVTLALTAFSGALTLQTGALAAELIADRSDVPPAAAGRAVALLMPAAAGVCVVVLSLSLVALVLRAVRVGGSRAPTCSGCCGRWRFSSFSMGRGSPRRMDPSCSC